MFVIKTRVGPSAIHGTGVFAGEPVAAGDVVWRFDPIFDRVIPDEALASLSSAALEHVAMYAYRSADLGGQLVLSADHAKFLNHDADPNTEERPFLSVARRAIETGDEITCDYGAFCTDWTGPESFQAPTSLEPGSPPTGQPGATAASLPHRNLYTRIRSSSRGVGVFAIRDIPADTVLFVGDVGATVRVAMTDVEKIEDRAIRQMYLDFCPALDGYLIAPADFNQITMGWYLNHSDHPNVMVRDDLQFSTRTPIAAGEELTADYSTYSAQTAAFIGSARG